MNHEHWMKEALKEAVQAQKEGEVPVGAVVVNVGIRPQIIGKGHNQIETLQDPTAHAEILAITSATTTIKNWRLNGATLYVTIEPCPMCAGAIMLSRISSCIFGAKDPRLGSFGSVYNIKNSQIKVISGILETECKSLMEDFFKKLRTTQKNQASVS